MFGKIWQWIKNFVQRLLGKTPPPEVERREATPLLSDAEYEAIFLELLAGVEKGWSQGNVQGFLISKNVKEGDLVDWLRRFGDRIQQTPTQHEELARRMVMLENLSYGRLSEVAGKIARKILPPPPLPTAPPLITKETAGEDVWDTVIDAEFVGDGISVSARGIES